MNALKYNHTYYNTLIRTNSTSSENSGYGFENCDWQSTSYCKVGVFPAVDTPLDINAECPPVILPFNTKL